MTTPSHAQELAQTLQEYLTARKDGAFCTLQDSGTISVFIANTHARSDYFAHQLRYMCDDLQMQEKEKTIYVQALDDPTAHQHQLKKIKTATHHLQQNDVSNIEKFITKTEADIPSMSEEERHDIALKLHELANKFDPSTNVAGNKETEKLIQDPVQGEGQFFNK